MTSTSGLIETLVALPVFESEWVLWLLFGLSVLSIAVILERGIFLYKRRINPQEIRERLDSMLGKGDLAGAVRYLGNFDSMETNVSLYGLRAFSRGPDAVQDLIEGAEEQEKLRYGRFLPFLATLGSNAPFIGLFGTVLGIIKAFKELSGSMAGASQSVMGGISEALIATAVGLLVAIPAVIAYNALMSRVKQAQGRTALMSKIVLSHLKSEVAQ